MHKIYIYTRFGAWGYRDYIQNFCFFFLCVPIVTIANDRRHLVFKLSCALLKSYFLSLSRRAMDIAAKHITYIH
jgi:hypothetical protein